MTCRLHRRFSILALALTAIVTGCGVSQEVVDEKESALQHCESRLQVCRSDGESCAVTVARLEEDVRRWRDIAGSDLKARERVHLELVQSQEELDACRRTAEAADREAKSLETREQQLRARLEQELTDRNVEIENLQDRLAVRVLDKILFDTGRAEIRPEGKRVLDKVGAVLADGTEKIRVEGHTDNVPIGPVLKEKYFSNWELSGARAASVVRYFQSTQAIDPARMEAVGHSLYAPIDTNDTPEGRQRNRRVEIVLSGGT